MIAFDGRSSDDKHAQITKDKQLEGIDGEEIDIDAPSDSYRSDVILHR